MFQIYLITEIQILESISKILSRYICIAILPILGRKSGKMEVKKICLNRRK
ncbi:MAG: hypothetical protein PV344_06700 [Anaplasma sp.]|nr:hypothetical protein [Anaplasma sp.]